MVPEIKRFSWIARLMAVTAGLILGLGACGGLAVKEQRKGQLGAAEQQQLNSSLTLASAAADAGQLEAAKRLYTQLSRHFPSAPKPRLGLGYLALEAGAFTLAGKLFAEAVERSATPAAKADALLGAGRASLGKGDTAGAKAHFLAASKLAKNVRAEAWVVNGLGVVATIEGDHAGARTRYEEALKLSPSHPMITANLVRALAQSGAGDEARRLYADYPASYWLDRDGAELSGLLKDTDTAATASDGAVAASGAKVQLYSARSRDGALAAWARLSAEEKDLLGPLTHRVVKVEISKRGVFHRLRAGPLADKAAAKRLCGLLKGRGRDCLVLAGKWTGGHRAGGGDRPGPAEKSPDAGTGDVPDIAASPPPAVTKESPSEAPEAGENAAGSGAKVQLYSARARDGALAAWARLSAEEKDLLGSLTHRVVKVEISKRGVFYRLRAGPLADKAAARRLCGLLKGRGRDCLVLAGKWTGGHRAGGGDRPGPAEKSPDAGTGDVPDIAASPPPAVTKESPSEAPEAGENAAGSGARVQLYSARSRNGALAVWARLSAEEKDLLGSLTHRVVKAEIPKRGVFYRLRVGPLADKAAARRLCGLLKGRGRACFVPAEK